MKTRNYGTIARAERIRATVSDAASSMEPPHCSEGKSVENPHAFGKPLLTAPRSGDAYFQPAATCAGSSLPEPVDDGRWRASDGGGTMRPRWVSCSRGISCWFARPP